jgi:hypothetical protein
MGKTFVYSKKKKSFRNPFEEATKSVFHGKPKKLKQTEKVVKV